MRTLRSLPALAPVVALLMLAGAQACAQNPAQVGAQTPGQVGAQTSGEVAAQTTPDVVSLDVRGLDIDNLLQFFSRTFGLTVIKDPGLTGPVTIMSPQPMSRQQAFDTLNAVLGVRGFTSILNGSVLKIVTLAKAVQSNVGLSVGRSPSQEGDLVITQIVPLKSANAAQLQSDLTPLITAGASIIANTASNALTITDYASNIARLLQIIDQLDSVNATQVRVFPLIYAQAPDVAPLLTQVFFTQQTTTGTSGTQQPGFMRRLTGGPGGLAALIGRSATAAPVGQVVADSRTNSLIVSTSKERMDAIGETIKGLDRPVERRGNLTVVALQRANAQDVATALNQALGARTTGATATTTSRLGSMSTSTALSGSSLGTGFGGSTPGRAEAAPVGGRQEPAPAGGAPPAAVLDLGPTPQASTPPAGTAQPQLANVLQLGGNATVVAEPNTNSLIITGTPESAALIRQLIEQLDEAPPQVLIEAIVAEVSLDAEHKLGFEWSWAEHPAFGNNDLAGTLATSFGLAAEGATGLTYAIAGTSFDSLLHALTTNDSVSILSTPRIFTSNNRQAVINISTATPYINSVLTGEVTQTFSVQYLDVGVILQVTPQIAPDGTVTMQVVQQANELLGFRNLGNNLTAPTVATRSAQATVRVSDGQTVILGGIISNNVTRNEDKVPLLGDLPLLGALFRHSTVSKTRSELLVFLTPRVVRTPEEVAALTASEQAKSIAPVPSLHSEPVPGEKSGAKGSP